MKKKYIKKSILIISVLILIISILTACGAGDTVESSTINESTTATDKDTNTTIEPSNQVPKDIEASADTNVDYLELIKQGKIDSLDFYLGAAPSEITNKLGQPVENGWFAGSEYINYDNMSFFFNEYLFAISLNEGKELYGIILGKSSIEDVKNNLGVPTKEFQDVISDEDEFSTNSWKLIYEVGKYRLEFYSNDNKSPVNIAYFSEIF